MRKRWDVIIDLIREYDLKVGAEVGVKNGENILHIVRACPDFKIFGIDCWDPNFKYQAWSKGAQAVHERRFNDIVKQYPERIVKMKGWSLDEVVKFDDGSLDIVFIDGDHSYEACLADLRAWLPKVRSGGVICGHDYGHPKIGKVKKAVDEYFGEVLLGDDFVWVYHKK